MRVFYDTTRSPAESGFSALAGWAGERGAGVGFPRIRCELTSRRPGYWAVLGWIQWVTQEYPAGRRAVRLVDRLPSLLDRDLPFHSYGYAPTFFDAPAYNSLPAVDWRASLWLCTVPLLGRDEAVAPLWGARWGYRIVRDGSAPAAYPLRPATSADWSAVRSQLLRRHRAWRFAAGYDPYRPAATIA